MKKFLIAALLICAGTLAAQAQGGRGAAPAGPPNPFLGKPEAAAHGQDVFSTNCAMCHGANAGGGEIGPALVTTNMSAPLRGESGPGLLATKIQNGVPGTVMPAWKDKLSNDDILQVVAFIVSLRGNAIDNPLPGNVAHGEEIFWGKGECGTCHMIKGRGKIIGPDLTNIAAERKAPSIVNALTKEMHELFIDGGAHLKALPPMTTYPPVKITLKTKQAIDGVMLNQDGYSVQLLGNDEKLYLLDRSKIASITQKSRSIMPTDYDKRLTKVEFTDLMAFLTRQGRKVAAAGGGRGASADD